MCLTQGGCLDGYRPGPRSPQVRRDFSTVKQSRRPVWIDSGLLYLVEPETLLTTGLSTRVCLPGVSLHTVRPTGRDECRLLMDPFLW